MESYFYKTDIINISLSDSFIKIKDNDKIYSIMSIINNSEEEIKIVEHDENVDVNPDFGTILGPKKMLSYDYVPKNSIYISTTSETEITILIKYSE